MLRMMHKRITSLKYSDCPAEEPREERRFQQQLPMYERCNGSCCLCKTQTNMRESERWLPAACLPLISLVTTAQTQWSKLYGLRAIYPITELEKPIAASAVPSECLFEAVQHLLGELHFSFFFLRNLFLLFGEVILLSLAFRETWSKQKDERKQRSRSFKLGSFQADSELWEKNSNCTYFVIALQLENMKHLSRSVCPGRSQLITTLYLNSTAWGIPHRILLIN